MPRLVHVRLYPLLAPLYWARRRLRLRRLREQDRRELAAHPDGSVPQADLRYDIVGPCTISEFDADGRQRVADMERALRSIGVSLDRLGRILDFGSGCGRVARILVERGLGERLSICDVNERAVEWCRDHLPLRQCVVNGELPPLPFEDASFDLVWCGSVFSHLDRRRQDRWLADLGRVLRPGGTLLASVHGPHAWQGALSERTIARLEQEGMLFVRSNANVGIHPSWYQVAWHTEAYVRSHWAAFFSIRDYVPRGHAGYQDLVIASKPADPAA